MFEESIFEKPNLSDKKSIILSSETIFLLIAILEKISKFLSF